MAWWKEDAAEVGKVLRVFFKHTVYVAIAIACMRFIEWLIIMLFGNALAFDLFPMGWPFLAGDLGMAIAFDRTAGLCRVADSCFIYWPLSGGRLG